MPVLFFLLLLPLTTLWGQNNATVYHYFKGAVNEQYSITMELKQEGQLLEGNYFYDKYRTNIRVRGAIGENQTIV